MTRVHGRNALVAVLASCVASQAALAIQINPGDPGQPGDPARAARALLTLVGLERPPTRLFLGEDALALVEQKIESMRAELGEWEALSRSTSFA